MSEISPRSILVLAALVVVTAFASPAFSRSERTEAPAAYVTASIARVRAGPSKKEPVVETLRIGAQVARGGTTSGFVKVTTRGGQVGYIKKTYLSARAPNFETLLATATNKKKKLSERKRAAERAVGLRPANEAAIAALIEILKARATTKRGKMFHHMAVKGIIAAERRNVSWDGPLYPIKDGVAYLPFACTAAFEAGRVTHDKVTLRARTFPLVASGKVVSVTEGGYRTEKLTTPACRDGQATYTLPPGARNGALVPSWLVAGFLVQPLRAQPLRAQPLRAQPNAAKSPGAHGASPTSTRQTWQSADGAWALVPAANDGEGWRVMRRSPRDVFEEVAAVQGAESNSTPVAVMSENERDVAVLFIADGQHRACASPERAAWVWRFAPTGGAGQAAHGHRYHHRFVPGCAQHVFAGLEGEPRCARLPEGCELGTLDVDYPPPYTTDAAPPR